MSSEKDNRSIREAVEYLSGQNKTDTIFFIDAEVNSVDLVSRLCNCTAVGGKSGNTFNARLMSSIDDGELKSPTEGSTITILISDFTDPIVIGYSGIDTICWRGGDLGGLPIVGILLQKINNLENAYNDLVLKFNLHTHNVTSTGAPTGPNLDPEETVLTLTELDEIENKAITQG